MNIRKAKKLYPNNVYLKEIISRLKAGSRANFTRKNTKESRHLLKLLISLDKDLNKLMTKHLKNDTRRKIN